MVNSLQSVAIDQRRLTARAQRIVIVAIEMMLWAIINNLAHGVRGATSVGENALGWYAAISAVSSRKRVQELTYTWERAGKKARSLAPWLLHS